MHTEVRVVETARGPIEFVELGRGPAVMVSHGTMGGWDQSELLIRTLTEPGFRYLALSRPGYGRTPLSSGQTCEEQADLLAALLDSLDIEQAAIIGVSGGGPAALQLALRHPGRVWGLVLVSTCARKAKTPKPPPGWGLMANLLRWKWLRDKARENMRRNLAKPAEMFLSDHEAFERTRADPEVGPLLEQFFLGTIDGMELRVPGTRNDIATMGNAEHALEQIELETLL
ncbi:MAG: alpha/beta fold hydrolase, partial [Acidimicrobiia bacterium]